MIRIFSLKWIDGYGVLHHHLFESIGRAVGYLAEMTHHDEKEIDMAFGDAKHWVCDGISYELVEEGYTRTRKKTKGEN